MSKNKNLSVLLLLLFVFATGLILRLDVFSNYLHNFKLVGDAQNYYLMSHQIVDKGIYGYGLGRMSQVSNAYVTPMYPLFLSTIYGILGDKFLQITVVRLLQIIVSGVLTPLVSYLLINQLFKRKYIAILTAFFTAVYPTYVLSCIQILTEVLALFTMLLYLYLLVLGLEKRSKLIIILAGVAFAIQILVRPAMLPLIIIPYCFMFFTWYKDDRKSLLYMFILHCVGFVIIMMPWWIRNYVVLHQIILTATSSGNPLLAGTYPDLKDLFGDTNNEIMKNSDTQAEYGKMRIIKGFTNEPLVYLKWYTIGKIQVIFGTPWLYKMNKIYMERSIIGQIFFVGVGSIGVIVNSIFSKIHRYINLYALLFLCIYLVFIPVTRYAYQHMFFLMLAAAYVIISSITFFIKTLKNRKVLDTQKGA
ncbi:MAG TPA: glycosyltransferase family 39 protein [Ruminiclostridium sp.]